MSEKIKIETVKSNDFEMDYFKFLSRDSALTE